MKLPTGAQVIFLTFMVFSIPLTAQAQTPSIKEFFIVWTNSPVKLPYAIVTFSATAVASPAGGSGEDHCQWRGFARIAGDIGPIYRRLYD